MSFSNRALYRGGATNHGRGVFSGTTGRALFSGPSWISPSEKYYFSGYDNVTGSTAWTQANYEQCQADALSAVRADTSLSYDSYSDIYYPAMILASCHDYYGEESYARSVFKRWKFGLPSGKRGSITKVRVKASCAAGHAWGHHDYGGYINYDNAVFDDFGSDLLLYFSASSTAYASGADLLDGTPHATVAFADINDAHDTAGRVLRTGELPSAPGYPQYAVYPEIVLDLDSVAATLNGLSSDTIYMWAAITRPSYLPFVNADPGDGAPQDLTKDFYAQALFGFPQLLVTTT